MSFKDIKVTFIKDAFVNGKRVFKSGDKKELNYASAQRWIVRGIAVEGEVKPEIKEEEEVVIEEVETQEEKPVARGKGKKNKKEDEEISL